MSLKLEGPPPGRPLKRQCPKLLHDRPDDEGLGAVDRVGRAGCLAGTFWGDGEYVDLSCRLTDCVQMVVVVPEHLVDGFGGQQGGEVRDRTGSVEVKNLKTLLPGDGHQFS